MSKVFKLDSDEWILSTDLLKEPLQKKVQFDGSPIVFGVRGEKYIENGIKAYGLDVLAEPNILTSHLSYNFECQAFLSDGTRTTVDFDETDGGAEFVGHSKHDDFVSVKLILKKVASDKFYSALNADLQSYIERGPTITIVGSDGGVPISRRLLEMRSEVIEAMFKYDTLENQTGQIKMEEFDSETLEAFKKFLMTGKICDGKKTALGLIILADMYGIQSMKETAEDYVKRNIKDMDKEQVLDIFSRVSRQTLVDAMIKTWSKE